jgi:hypothetical protein
LAQHQRLAHEVFQLLDDLGDRRLGDRQGLGGRPHVAVLGGGQQAAHMLQSHPMDQ